MLLHVLSLKVSKFVSLKISVGIVPRNKLLDAAYFYFSILLLLLFHGSKVKVSKKSFKSMCKQKKFS